MDVWSWIATPVWAIWPAAHARPTLPGPAWAMIYWHAGPRARGWRFAGLPEQPGDGEDHGHDGKGPRAGLGPRRPSTRSIRRPPRSSPPSRSEPTRSTRPPSGPARRRCGGPGLSWKERRTRLLAWKSHIIRYLGRLAELVHTETGKPLADAQLEILLAIVHIDWAAGTRARCSAAPGPARTVAINQAATARVPAARRRRRDRPVELPGLHPDGVDRLRAGRG